MTAKEIQLKIVKEYLKPRFKSLGYLTRGQNWWKDKGDFYVTVNLQNFSWNSKDKVDFCFNTGITLKVLVKDLKNPIATNNTISIREGFYLPENRKQYKYRNPTGYTLTNEIDENKFLTQLIIDFEDYILPQLEKLTSIENCVSKFGDLVFSGEYLKKAIADYKLM